MNFAEAIQAVWAGKKVRSISWDKDEYIQLKNGAIVGEDGEEIQEIHFTRFSQFAYEIYDEECRLEKIYNECMKKIRELEKLAKEVNDMF